MFRALPLLLLGVVLSAYWGRVLRMAYKARLRTGRAANFLPGERLGLALRVIWAPVVIVWVAQPFCAALWRGGPEILQPLYFNSCLAWPALVVAMACLLLSLICWKAMGRHWRMGLDPREHNPLIATGPFACVRHPIYALSAVMMLASVATIPSPLMLAAGAIHITLLFWESRREESHLLQLHQDLYRAYQRRVGAFVPKLFHRPVPVVVLHFALCTLHWFRLG